MKSDIAGTMVGAILGRVWLWVVLVVAVFFVIEFAPEFFGLWRRRRKFRAGEQWRSGRELILWLQQLTPTEFEQYIAHLFKNLGYTVEVTGASHDGGIDVIAEKNGVTHYIQCKKFITRQVPVGAVRDFYGAMADKGARAKGFFITTNTFTLEAEKFAENTPIELIDGSKLAEYIQQSKIGTAVPSPAQKICPRCSSAMVKRSGKFGEFYGCTRYPDCKGTDKI